MVMEKQDRRYLDALEWIHSTGRFGMKPGLERITALLDLCGNPHRSLRFVHIGGTNGKGSTAAMLASMLQSAGYTAALYTSPYLLSFTNRMAVNGSDIEPRELVELVEQLRPLVQSVGSDPRLGPLTEFEVVTALALLFFARRRPDLVVFEVGLGGRLDATNIVTPLAAIITNISLEHTAVLGDTVEEIAREKAGIIKPGIPLVTAANERALEVISQRCREQKAALYRVAAPGENRSGLEITAAGTVTFTRKAITHGGQRFGYHGLHRRLEDLFIPLRGEYQVCNAATALACLELLGGSGYPAGEESIRLGLAATRWPGRLEVLSRDPLLILDGAHNPGAMLQLSRAVQDYFDYERLVLVIGVLADKDKTMLAPVLSLAGAVVLTAPDAPRAAGPDEVAPAVRELFSGPVVIEPDVGRALEQALQMAGPNDAVLVTGSLYTVSDARACWEKIE